MKDGSENKQERISELFIEALDVPSSQWKNWVETHCTHEEKSEGIDTQILKLLKSSARADAFFEALNKNIEDDIDGHNSNIPFKPGDIFEKFKIISELGHGGMASVFLCERIDGQFEQKVAIKIMKVKGNTDLLKDKFRQEQQILARFNHPNIAQLYDGGISEEGFPYMIMEYVEGESIDKYCDRKKLSVNERIKLFTSVCEAVQYAHSNLIIHLDLKPDNILVTESGRIKILDFGIAALQNTKKDKNNNTDQPRFMTLHSAAPEQITAISVTTKSDIYSLGLLLHRLLAGCHPHNLENKNYVEVKKTIRNGIVAEPSEKFISLDKQQQKKIAQSRQTTPGKLVSKLKGDLDAILVKALQKEQKDRYDSITQFLDDINYYEKQLPVKAHKGSIAYFTSKFINRNVTAISISSLVFLLISTIIFYYSQQLRSERDIAIYEAQKAEEVTAFLLELFEANDPAYAQGEKITAQDMLERGLERTREIQNAQLMATMLTTIGDAFTRLSEFEKALQVLEKAIEYNLIAFGENTEQYADAIFAMGVNHADNHMWHLALPAFERAFSIYDGILPDTDPKVSRTLSRLGLAYRQNNDFDKARNHSEKAYQLMGKNVNQSEPDLLKTMSEYAVVIAHEEPERAEQIMIDVIDGYHSFTDSLDYRLAIPYNRLAFHYRNQKNYEAAEKYYREALKVSIHTMGEGHRFTQMVRMNLVTPLIELGKYDDAAFFFQKNLELAKERYTENHWRTGSAYGSYAMFYTILGDYQKAESFFKKNLLNYHQTIGHNHIWTAYVEGALAACHRFLGNYEISDSLYIHHMEIYKERAPDFNNDHVSQIRRLIKIYKEADGSYEDVIDEYLALLK